MIINFCRDDVFWTAEPFVTKLSMLGHHHELDCHVKRLLYCLQGQGHNEGSCNQNMTVYYFSWTADSFSTTLSLMVHYHELECLVERFYCCVQGQGHSRGSCFHVCPDDIFWTAEPFVTNWVWWCIIIGPSVMSLVFCHARWQTLLYLSSSLSFLPSFSSSCEQIYCFIWIS